MSPVSRGFLGLRRPVEDRSRVPAGQYVTGGFPVLSAGPTPNTPLDQWSFRIDGEVDAPVSWTWAEFLALPAETPTVDIHCVTKWSKFDTRWKGVSVDTLLDGVTTEAEYLTAWSDGGYTTNLPLDDVTGGKAWVAYEYDGEPLHPEHGGPARLLVPHLYFWKSAKWVRGLTLTLDDEPGFWETLRLSQPRRPLAGTALPRRLSWQLGRVVELVDETGTDEEHRSRRSRLAGSPRRAARRRSPDCRGRLSGGAQLLDRVGAGGSPPRIDGRASRGRRGLALPDRCADAGRRARVARADRRLLHLGGVAGRAAAADRRRLRGRPVSRDVASLVGCPQRGADAPAVLVSVTRRSHLSRGATGRRLRRGRGADRADAPVARRLAGTSREDRRRASAAGRMGAKRASARLHLRSHRICRGRRAIARAARTRPPAGQDGTLWPTGT